MLGTVQGLTGEFRKASLNSPVVVLVGDIATVIGNQLVITRDGAVVATRFIESQESPVPLGAEQVETINHILYFWRPPVQGIIVTLADVTKNTANGEISFTFQNTTRSFSNVAQIRDATDYIDTQDKLAQDILIRKTIINSPDETNLTTMVGKKCAIDIQANVPFTVD